MGPLRCYPARLLIGEAMLCHRGSVCHLMPNGLVHLVKQSGRRQKEEHARGSR